MLVQSEKTAQHVEKRIEQFLRDINVSGVTWSIVINTTVQEILSSLSDEAFQKHVKALEVKKLEKPKKLDKENFKYLNEIESRQYCFDRGGWLCVND